MSVLEVGVQQVYLELERAIYQDEAFVVNVVVRDDLVALLDVEVLKSLADIEEVLSANIDVLKEPDAFDFFLEQLQILRLPVLPGLAKGPNDLQDVRIRVIRHFDFFDLVRLLELFHKRSYFSLHLHIILKAHFKHRLLPPDLPRML